MKRIGSLLLLSICAGAITLGAYKLFFENQKFAIVDSTEPGTVFNTSLTPTSAKGSGINEIDFTVAAENTVNAVVHIKNVTKGRTGSLSSIFLRLLELAPLIWMYFLSESISFFLALFSAAVIRYVVPLLYQY